VQNSSCALTLKRRLKKIRSTNRNLRRYGTAHFTENAAQRTLFCVAKKRRKSHCVAAANFSLRSGILCRCAVMTAQRKKITYHLRIRFLCLDLLPVENPMRNRFTVYGNRFTVYETGFEVDGTRILYGLWI